MARMVYDGECSFCTHAARKAGANGRVECLPSTERAGHDAAVAWRLEDRLADTVLVEFRGRTYTESAAAVRVLFAMGKGWPLLGGALWLVPKPLRDAGYRWVARNRHRFTGAAA